MIKTTIVNFGLAPTPPGVPGDGPDGYLPSKIGGFGPDLARMQGAMDFEFSF